jgi:hypothetical protein
MLIILVFPLDPRPPWGTLTKLHASASHYIHQAWHTLSSPSPQSFVNLGNGPLGLSPLATRVLFIGIFSRMGYAYLSCLEALVLD